MHESRVVAVTTGWELRYVGDKPRLVTAFTKPIGRWPTGTEGAVVNTHSDE